YRHVCKARRVRLDQPEACCLHYDLGYLSARNIVVRAEGAVSVPVYEAMKVCCLDVRIVRVVRRHVAEVPTHARLHGHTEGEHHYLGELASISIVVWPERTVLVPGDHTCRGQAGY